jgi:hypothetical protein
VLVPGGIDESDPSSVGGPSGQDKPILVDRVQDGDGTVDVPSTVTVDAPRLRAREERMIVVSSAENVRSVG